MKRREFLKYSAILTPFLVPFKINANQLKQTTIVVLGGGFGGLSVAKYLKKLDPLFNVILVEKNRNFISCPFSNAWLGNIENISFESLNFDYNSAVVNNKYNFINDTILEINRKKKEVLTTNHKIKYDYLVMSLGIDYNYKKIFKNDKQKIKDAKLKAPAGLKGGSDILKLKKMISEFKGGNFILSLPKTAYKCPPAPYERACMIANYFKENSIKGKVVILDPRAKPASKAKAFLEVFSTIYKDYIEYKRKHKLIDVDFSKKTVKYKYFDNNLLKDIKKDLAYCELSIIPPNRANKLYKKSGISTYTNGYVKLKRPTMQSIDDKYIFIIGDAQGEYTYPKSAQMANSCALIVANDIFNKTRGKEFDYKKNLPGNICYSILAPKKASWVIHDFSYDNANLERYTSSSQISNTNIYSSAILWYEDLMDELFGV